MIEKYLKTPKTGPVHFSKRAPAGKRLTFHLMPNKERQGGPQVGDKSCRGWGLGCDEQVKRSWPHWVESSLRQASSTKSRFEGTSVLPVRLLFQRMHRKTQERKGTYPPPLKKITYAKKFLRNYFRSDCDDFA